MPHHDLPHLRLEIDRQRAEFADAAVEDRFNRHHLPERSAQLKVSLLFCAAFYVAFGVTDVATLGPGTTAWAMIALRGVVEQLGVAHDDVFVKGYWNLGRPDRLTGRPPATDS